MKKNIISIVLSTSLFASNLFATKTMTTKIHNQYTSFRALGMGNAFTAVADDYTLIFYNPAGFANKKDNEIQMSFVGAGVSKKTIDVAKDVSDASKIAGTDDEKAVAIANALEKYYGESLGGRLTAAEIFWIRKHWGFALIPLDLTLDMTINRQLGPSIDLKVIGDTTAAFGIGREYNKNISWGVMAKGIHRVSIDENLPSTELASNSDLLSEDRMAEGITIDGDIGLMYKPNWFVKKVTRQRNENEKKALAEEAKKKAEELKAKTVEAAKTELSLESKENVSATSTVVAEGSSETTVVTTEKTEETSATTETVKTEDKAEEMITEEKYPLTFGAVVRNVLGGKFAKSKLVNKDAVEAPDNLDRVIDVGTQYEIAQFGSLTIRSMLDIRDMLHPNISTTKSLHAGLEFDFSPSGWFKTQLRGGFNQGYYTAGATFLLGFINIEAVTYGEEVGTKNNKLESRIYAAKLGMNF